MKNAILVFFSILSFSIAQASTSFTFKKENNCPLVIDQLVELNKYWQYNLVKDPILQERICFEKHTDLIQLHLRLVEKYLRLKNVSDLSFLQKTNRKKGLDILKNYWQAAKFPTNNHHPGQVVPYFIDDYNTACAVGHIVRETGFGNFTEKVRMENNYAYIENMDYPELGVWAEDYGFDEIELRWIQPGYSGPNVFFLEDYIYPNCGESDGSILIDVQMDLGWFNIDSLDVAIFKWYEGNNISGNPIAFSESLHNVPAGEYTLWVDDLMGDPVGLLPAYKTFRLSNANASTYDVQTSPETCEGELNGSILINILNGSSTSHQFEFYQVQPQPIDPTNGNYNHAETLIGSTNSIESLSGSNIEYRVKITDTNSCVSFQDISLLTNSVNVNQSFSSVQPNCGSNNGTIELSQYSNEPLSFHWDNGSTDSVRYNVSSGNYSVTATDVNGCQASTGFFITNGDGPTLNYTNVSETHVTCLNANDGTITIDLVDGTPPFNIKWYKADPLQYPYIWNLDGNINTPSSNYTISNLEGDLIFVGGFVGVQGKPYRVELTDGNGCVSEYQTHILNPDVSSLYQVDVTNPTQCWNPDGVIFLNNFSCVNFNCLDFIWADGGVGNYRVGVEPGVYDLVIYNTCTQDTFDTTQIYVGGGIATPSVEIDPGTCNNPYGSATINMFSNDDFTYNWSYGNYQNVAQNLPPDDYQVTITNSNSGCTELVEFEIKELNGAIINPLNINVQNATNGQSNGQASVTATSNNNDFTYSWSHDNSITTSTAVGLAEGTYFVMAVDGNGCSAEETIIINNNVSTVNPNLVVTNTNDNGLGSLRAAIEYANTNNNGSSYDTITFDIQGTGLFIITLDSYLPTLKSYLVIDATTQPDYFLGKIKIDGSNLQGGLFFSEIFEMAPFNEIYGFHLTQTNSNVVYGFYPSSNCKIGDVGKGNIISNFIVGIRAAGQVQNLEIKGNYIGTDETGQINQGNSEHGILIMNNPGAKNILIDGNLISGNGDSGTDAGIRIQGHNSQEDQNIKIINNVIGTNIDGTQAIPNQSGIVFLHPHKVNIENNIISGNTRYGINGIDCCSGNPEEIIIIGNKIGTDAFGASAIPNGRDGINMQRTKGGVIGGTNGDENIIAFNGDYGIRLGDSTQNLQISNNSIFCNVDGGIFNAIGANSGLTPPLIQINSLTQIQGTSSPNSFIDIYSDDDANCSNAPCQAKNFVGSAQANNNGLWNFIPNPPFTLNTKITVLATLDNNTSSFAECVTVNNSSSCYDPSIITGNPCTQQYVPVCGCDGNTYSNSCFAGEAGITTYTAGECINKPTLVSLLNTEIQIDYHQDILESSVTTSNLSFMGDDTGFKNGSYTVDGNILTFNPSSPFKAGEKVFITSSSNILSTSNVSMPSFVWMEYAPVTNSTSAIFTEESTGIILPIDALNYQYNLTLADFNKDGEVDLVFYYYSAYGNPTNILVYLNNGNGGFASPLTYTNQNSHSSLRGTPDLNNDGYPDIVVTHNLPSRLHIRLNNGNGTFSDPFYYPLAQWSNGVEYGDIDGDGDIDIVGKTGIASLSQNKISILRNNGDGTFQGEETITTGVFGSDVNLADMDGDGDLDIHYLTSTAFGSNPVYRVFENDGIGNYTESYNEANDDVKTIVGIFDFNNDGMKDIISENPQGEVHLDNMGTNTSLSNPNVVFSENVRMVIGDINGDGHLDLFNNRTYNGTDWVSLPYKVFTNDGQANFSEDEGTFSLGVRQSLKMIDAENDGDLDIAYITADREIFFAINQGTVNTDCFQIAIDVQKATCPNNNDGILETFIFGGTPPFSYLWSTGETTSSISGLQPDAYSITVTDATGCEVNTVVILGQYVGDEVALPDGTGEVFSNTINISGFDSNALLTDQEDLLSVCVTMEHSWMRDMEIKLVCPDGTELILHDHPGSFGGEVFLGEPFENDENLNPPIPGVGYEYCWSSFSTNGTWIEYANSNNPSTLPAGDYNPFESFSNFIGCPMNGPWTIKVEDLWGVDNGYIFDWNISFANGDNSEEIILERENCPNELTFILNSSVGQSGTSIQVPITTKGFESIVGFSYTIQLDNPTVGAITGITGAALSPDEVLFDPLTLGVAWNNPSGGITGLSLPDDEIIFYVNIELDGTAGSCTDISFENLPLEISAVNSQNGQSISISAETVDGQVCAMPDGGDSCDNPIPISCGQTMPGNNEFGAALDSVYSCMDNLLNGNELYYVFNNTTEQDIIITLSGLSNDLELLLLDECHKDNCLRNSDRTGDVDEVIYWENLPVGEYYIIVDGYLGATSSFLLNIECGNIPGGTLDCSDSDILPCNATIFGNNGDGNSNVLQYGCQDAPDYESAPEYVYTLSNPSLDTIVVIVTMQDHVDDLDLFLLSECDRFACMAASTSSGIEEESFITTLLPGEINYVVVDGYNGAISDYNLVIQCFPADEFEDMDCSSSTPIACGDIVNSNNNTGVSSASVYCSGNYNSGTEKIYSFNNPYEQDVILLLTGLSENLDIYLLDSCTVLSGCISAGDKSGTSDEGVIVEDLPAGDYIIVVDGYDGAISDFTLEIQCVQHDVIKSGRIVTENGTDVQDVEVSCNDTLVTLTDATGNYEFDPVPAGEDYTIEPHKDVNYRNGIQLLDYILIRDHYLGNQELDSPYKLIAADVNNDCKINVADEFLVKALFLFSIDDLSEVESWRFVPEEFVFGLPSVGCDVPLFDESIFLPDLALDALEQDFVAVKMGDVTQDAAGDMFQNDDVLQRTNDVIQLVYPELERSAGEEFLLPIFAKDEDEKIKGFQMELVINQEEVEIIEITSNVLLGSITSNLNPPEEGKILLAWNHPQGSSIDLSQLKEDEALFTIRCKQLKKTNKTLPTLSLSEVLIGNMAYNDELQPKSILLERINSDTTNETIPNKDELILFQNRPNPFSESTTIGFYLPASENIIFSIYDSTGKLISQNETFYKQGYHEFDFSDNLLQTSGLYFYRLQTPSKSLVKSMLFQK